MTIAQKSSNTDWIIKNRREQRVPLMPWVVERMREHRRRRSKAEVRAGRSIMGVSAIVFEVGRNTLAILRKDARFAGLGDHDEKGRRTPFHGLLASTATVLARAGVAPAVAMRVLRHSDPRLTMRVYAKLNLGDLAICTANCARSWHHSWHQTRRRFVPPPAAWRRSPRPGAQWLIASQASKCTACRTWWAVLESPGPRRVSGTAPPCPAPPFHLAPSARRGGPCWALRAARKSPMTPEPAPLRRVLRLEVARIELGHKDDRVTRRWTRRG